jgi:hypothetical protein
MSYQRHPALLARLTGVVLLFAVARGVPALAASTQPAFPSRPIRLVAVAKAASDGYTLLFTATAHGTVGALHKNLPRG